MRSSTLRLAPLAAMLLMAASAPPAAAGEQGALQAKPEVDRILAGAYPRLDALYKDIHQHPELGFQEVRTARKLAAELRGLGFEVTEGVGKTGVVGFFRNGEGPTIMVRTELDALPMAEKTGLPYASTAVAAYQGENTPVAHSCGHDIHMASWVGAATALVALKDRWRGTLMFVAQPSEENDSGADAMLADGLFTRFGKPDYALALHTGPFAYGMVGYRPGPIMSAEDTLRIDFAGRGGHGSSPSTTIDPVLIASRFVVEVQAVVSREKDPKQFGVVTIGAIHGGTAGNIIPDEVTLRGTVRSYDAGVRAKLLGGVERVASAASAMSGAPAPKVTITHDANPVVNTPAVTEAVGQVFKAAFGPRAFVIDPVPASEDFSKYTEAGVPSMYFFIGALEPQAFFAALKSGQELPSNHSPLFAPVPEPTIKTGATAMTLAVMDLMK